MDWQNKLSQVKQERESFGLEVNSGASEKDISDFQKIVFERLHFLPDNDYLTMLRVVNGIEYNGHIVYGIDDKFYSGTANQGINGFIEQNEIWYEDEDFKRYVFYGQDSMTWYVYDLEDRTFCSLDLPSGSLIDNYASFFEMIESILQKSLL